MSRSQSVIEYFTGHNSDAATIFRGIDGDGDGFVSWEEFVAYCSSNDDLGAAELPDANSAGEITASVDQNNDSDAISRYLQVEFREDSTVFIAIMEPGDTRVLMAPRGQLLKVSSTSHAVDISAEYARKLNLTPAQHAMLFEQVEKAIIKVCFGGVV